jgi:DNA-binding beta-propeller fold protein YncE
MRIRRSTLNAARTPTLVTLTWLCALLGLLALTSAPASALETHVFSKSFAGEEEHALSDPQGVAIDQSTGEVYVVDGANDRVEIFSSSGAFIKAFGTAGSGSGQFKEPTQIAVDNSTGMPGDVYVLDGGNDRVEVFNAKGEYVRQITTTEAGLAGPIIGVAVDTGGNLWLFTQGQPLGDVYEYPPGGALPGRLIFSLPDIAAGVNPGLALDSSGDLYIFRGSRGVIKLEPSGNPVAEFGSGSAMTIDPANQDLYVDEGASVAHYLAPDTGTLNDVFGSVGPNKLVAGAGVAVNGSTGDVYVADSAGNRVDVFTPTTLAEVHVGAATGVEQTVATLHGTVNPDEIPVSACEFEYVSVAAFDSTGSQGGFATAKLAPCAPPPPYTGKAPQTVEAQLSGLTASTSYYYRLAATDSNGTSYGFSPEIEAVTTLPAVQGLSTGPAEDATEKGAKLTGSLSPDGTDAHYYFEYSLGETPEGACSEAAGCFESPAFPTGTDAGSGGPKCKPPGGVECSPVAAETILSGLVASTVYHYRLVGVDSFGATYGGESTFTTPGAPTIEGSSAEVQPATKAGQTNATLQAQIDPHGRETTYHFEYGETTSYGTSVPATPGAIGSGEGSVSSPRPR